METQSRSIAYNYCAFPEDDLKREETCSCKILIVKLYLYFAGIALYNYQPKHEHEKYKIETENINFVIRSFCYQSLR
jgi:hypothetical protein